MHYAILTKDWNGWWSVHSAYGLGGTNFVRISAQKVREMPGGPFAEVMTVVRQFPVGWQVAP